MGQTARQFNDFYQKYKKRFKKPIMDMMPLFDKNFIDDEFVAKFKELYPHLWDDLCKQYKYWHNKNEYIIRLGKKSRYNFRKPYNNSYVDKNKCPECVWYKGKHIAAKMPYTYSWDYDAIKNAILN